MILKIKNKFFKIFKYSSYFEKKNNILIFLIIFSGVLVPTLSGTTSFHFWSRLYSILTNSFANMLFFLAVGLNVIFLSSELSKTYNIVIRCSNYKTLIKKLIEDIIITTIILYIVFIVLAISGAVMFSLNNFSISRYESYNISIVFYLILFIIRSALFICVINVIIYLSFLVLKKFFTIIIILLLSVLFIILNTSNLVINCYNMPLLYHYYFLDIEYSTLFLEIVCTIFQFIILFVIYKIIFKIVISKKRDLL